MRAAVTVETHHIADLIPAEQNPRIATQAGDRLHDDLEASFAQWGLAVPLVWNRRSGRMVSGHQRLTVLRAEGYTEVDVSVVDLDDDNEDGLRIALNHIDGTWNPDMVAEQITRLMADAPDVAAATGIDPDAAAALADPARLRSMLTASTASQEAAGDGDDDDELDGDRGPNALPYYGRKRHMVRWIVGLLPPPDNEQIWVEPCAGMAAVTLAREPAGTELINDLDGRIVAWWAVLRDPDLAAELARRLEYTPRSREEWAAAVAASPPMDEPPPYDDPDALVHLAWLTTVYIAQSIRSSLSASTSWGYGGAQHMATYAARLPAVTERMRRIRLEHRPAADIIAIHAPKPQAVLYIDPPYGGHNHEYGAGTASALADITAACLAPDVRARIAVSGYDGDQPELDAAGWTRSTLDTKTTMARSSPTPDADPDRVEVLWRNHL